MLWDFSNYKPAFSMSADQLVPNRVVGVSIAPRNWATGGPVSIAGIVYHYRDFIRQ